MQDGATAKAKGAGQGGSPRTEEVRRLADELAGSLHRTVVGCFEALVDDPAGLAALADKLGRAGHLPAVAPPRGVATAEDFAAVVDAISLIDRRLGELEERLKVLAEVTGTVARTVDELRADPGGGGATAPAKKEDEAGPGAG